MSSNRATVSLIALWIEAEEVKAAGLPDAHGGDGELRINVNCKSVTNSSWTCPPDIFRCEKESGMAAQGSTFNFRFLRTAKLAPWQHWLPGACLDPPKAIKAAARTPKLAASGLMLSSILRLPAGCCWVSAEQSLRYSKTRTWPAVRRLWNYVIDLMTSSTIGASFSEGEGNMRPAPQRPARRQAPKQRSGPHSQQGFTPAQWPGGRN